MKTLSGRHDLIELQREFSPPSGGKTLDEWESTCGAIFRFRGPADPILNGIEKLPNVLRIVAVRVSDRKLRIVEDGGYEDFVKWSDGIGETPPPEDVYQSVLNFLSKYGSKEIIG